MNTATDAKDTSWPTDFGSAAAARRAGMRAACGMPAIVLGASYIGFGALADQAGWSPIAGMISTTLGWALPGQIALVEIYAAGGSLLAAIVAVALANARLLPMVTTLLPILRQGAAERGPLSWRYFLAAHFIAITGWAIAMQRCPAMPPAQRLPFFAGFTLVLWLATILATALGFLASAGLPAAATLGLVFINPLYFMLIFVADLAHRHRAPALIIGAILGPLFHLLSPDWGLLATGLIGGSLAFLIGERHRRGKPR